MTGWEGCADGADGPWANNIDTKQEAAFAQTHLRVCATNKKLPPAICAQQSSRASGCVGPKVIGLAGFLVGEATEYGVELIQCRIISYSLVVGPMEAGDMG